MTVATFVAAALRDDNKIIMEYGSRGGRGMSGVGWVINAQQTQGAPGQVVTTDRHNLLESEIDDTDPQKNNNRGHRESILS